MKKHIKLFEDMFIGPEGSLGAEEDFKNTEDFTDSFDFMISEIIKDVETEIQMQFPSDVEQQKQAREKISHAWAQKIMEWAAK